ncbi:GPI transamidase component PIG-S [Tanacetum coccineum]
MAEITKSITTATSSPTPNQTTRTSKPGLKRLTLTLTVFISFLLGLPWLLKSIEIYRSPLPFTDIDVLSNVIEMNRLSFPCKFHVVYVDLDKNSKVKHNVENLGFMISSYMSMFDGNCLPGTCGDNYTVSVSLDSGVLREGEFDGSDEVVDEYLGSVLGNSRVYTIVVVNRGEGGGDGVRAVVGKYRHGWIVGSGMEIKVVAEKVAEMFAKVFVSGVKEEGSVQGEFMPVGADGRIVLSFNLLNADPRDWIYDWDFNEVDEKLLSPTLEALSPIANISVESQVLYHTPKSSYSFWDAEQESHIFSTKNLPFFVNSNEWHLDTSIAAGGRSKILQFVVYVL